MSPIVLTCTFVSLATNVNISGIIFLHLCTEVSIVAALWCRDRENGRGAKRDTEKQASKEEGEDACLRNFMNKG